MSKSSYSGAVQILVLDTTTKIKRYYEMLLLRVQTHICKSGVTPEVNLRNTSHVGDEHASEDLPWF